MTVIENLKNKLLNDEATKVNQIENEAKVKAEEILNSAKDKADGIQQDAKVKAEKDGRDKKDRMIARAQLDARNELLSAKQEAIDAVLNATVSKINAMKDEDYSKFIEKLLINNIETGEEEIIFSEADKKRINPVILENLNKSLVNANKKGNVKISTEVRNIASGFILKRGGLEINCSIDSQIRILRDSLEGEIANLLFEDR